jgi:hypothetical protein
MQSITLDEAVLEKLRGANGLTEIRDAHGNGVGFFSQVSLEHAAKYVAAAAQIDRAELARRKAKAEGCHTTVEVFEHLKTLTSDPAQQAHLQKLIDEIRARDESDVW